MANIQKKYGVLAVVFGWIFLSGSAFAQENQDKPLTLFKFYPLPLITNSMSFGVERMNSDQSRSVGLAVGVRYRRAENTQFDFQNGSNQSIPNFNQWQGGFVHVERRFYVPVFKKHEQGTWLDSRGSTGVYWAPTLLMDYSVNEFDKSGFETIFQNGSSQPIVRQFTNRGKVNLFSIKPSVVMGVQFSLFEHLYLDMSLGAGLRWLHKEESIQGGRLSQGYYSSDLESPTDELLNRAGVRISGQIAVGVKW